MEIGEPKRQREIEPVTVPVPETIPMPEETPAPVEEPAQVPVERPTVPAEGGRRSYEARSAGPSSQTGVCPSRVGAR